jgi:tyrosinase
LKSAGLTVGAFLLSSQKRGLSQNETPVPSGSLRVRPDVATLQPRAGQDHPIIKAYKKAVDLMKGGQVPNDHFRWEAQAKIHADWCPHRNWFFLPWHRAYLDYFERVIRTVSGDDNFVLPYWNWTKDPQVPAAFWGAGNPLFDSTRGIGSDEAMPAEAVGKDAIDTILALSDFELFGSARSTRQRQATGEGQLEETPHDTVHGTILGNMGRVPLSALDPIFWLHHANLDRLWEQWNRAGHKNTSDPAWTDFAFTNNFYDVQGTPVPGVKVSELDSTSKRGYRYDDQPEVVSAPMLVSNFKTLDALSFKTINTETAKRGLPLAARIRPTSEFFVAAREAAAPVKPEREKQVIRLVISDVTPPKENGALVRVFVNCPYLSVDTPTNDPHYVGSFSFFDVGAHVEEDHGKSAYTFDLTAAFRKLNRVQKLPKDQIQVQLLAIPKAKKKEAPIEFLPSKFEVSLAEVQD